MSKKHVTAAAMLFWGAVTSAEDLCDLVPNAKHGALAWFNEVIRSPKNRDPNTLRQADWYQLVSPDGTVLAMLFQPENGISLQQRRELLAGAKRPWVQLHVQEYAEPQKPRELIKQLAKLPIP